MVVLPERSISNRELKALFTVGAASAVLPGGISNRELKVVPQAA